MSEKDDGQADAINKGIRMSTGDIIAYLNSDDTYEKGALKKVADFFSLNPGVLWMTGRCRIIDREDREVRRAITAYKNFLLSHFSYRLLLVTNPISQPATFWKRKVVDELGYFDVKEHLVMDYEFWLRVGRKYEPGIINDYLACFRVHASSKTSVTNFGNFEQELAVAMKYSSSKTVRFLHRLNYAGIYSAYTLMAFFPRIRNAVSCRRRED
jgi:glycosyltransferase involved in cell wall biosynthesis